MKRGLSILVLLLSLLLFGCGQREEIPEEVFLNGEYYFDCLDKVVRLKDGRYSETIEIPSIEGTRPINPSIELEGYITGDVNGDGLEDEVAVVSTNCGGTAVFVSLQVLLKRGERFAYTAQKLLGDRVDVRSIGIRGEKIFVDMITHDEDDPMCCPTLRVKRWFIYSERGIEEIKAP